MTNDWMDDLLKEEVHKEIRVPSHLDREIRARLGDREEKNPINGYILGLLVLSFIYQWGLFAPALKYLSAYLSPGKLLALACICLEVLGLSLLFALVLIHQWKKGEI